MNKLNSFEVGPIYWDNKVHTKKWKPIHSYEETYDLTDEQIDGIQLLITWLNRNSSTDLTNTIKSTIKQLSYILIREYYTEDERDMLNTLREQYMDKIIK